MELCRRFRPRTLHTGRGDSYQITNSIAMPQAKRKKYSNLRKDDNLSGEYVMNKKNKIPRLLVFRHLVGKILLGKDEICFKNIYRLYCTLSFCSYGPFRGLSEAQALARAPDLGDPRAKADLGWKGPKEGYKVRNIINLPERSISFGKLL